jgi:hypothetical protein
MTNYAQKVSNLAITTTLGFTDRVVVIANASSTANVMTMTLQNFANSMKTLVVSNTAPANSSSAGISGQLAFDSSHLYVCIASNTWVRASLSTF